MKINIVLMLTGLLVTYSVYANDAVRTGLWEVTTRSDLLGLVQHVPQENMQQLQNLAKQFGLNIPKIENGAAISHVCITPEMAKQEIPTYFYENINPCILEYFPYSDLFPLHSVYVFPF